MDILLQALEDTTLTNLIPQQKQQLMKYLTSVNTLSLIQFDGNLIVQIILSISQDAKEKKKIDQFLIKVFNSSIDQITKAPIVMQTTNFAKQIAKQLIVYESLDENVNTLISLFSDKQIFLSKVNNQFWLQLLAQTNYKNLFPFPSTQTMLQEMKSLLNTDDIEQAKYNFPYLDCPIFKSQNNYYNYLNVKFPDINSTTFNDLRQFTMFNFLRDDKNSHNLNNLQIYQQDICNFFNSLSFVENKICCDMDMMFNCYSILSTSHQIHIQEYCILVLNFIKYQIINSNLKELITQHQIFEGMLTNQLIKKLSDQLQQYLFQSFIENIELFEYFTLYYVNKYYDINNNNAKHNFIFIFNSIITQLPNKINLKQLNYDNLKVLPLSFIVNIYNKIQNDIDITTLFNHMIDYNIDKSNNYLKLDSNSEREVLNNQLYQNVDFNSLKDSLIKIKLIICHHIQVLFNEHTNEFQQQIQKILKQLITTFKTQIEIQVANIDQFKLSQFVYFIKESLSELSVISSDNIKLIGIDINTVYLNLVSQEFQLELIKINESFDLLTELVYEDATSFILFPQLILNKQYIFYILKNKSSCVNDIKQIQKLKDFAYSEEDFVNQKLGINEIFKLQLIFNNKQNHVNILFNNNYEQIISVQEYREIMIKQSTKHQRCYKDIICSNSINQYSSQKVNGCQILNDIQIKQTQQHSNQINIAIWIQKNDLDQNDNEEKELLWVNYSMNDKCVSIAIFHEKYIKVKCQEEEILINIDKLNCQYDLTGIIFLNFAFVSTNLTTAFTLWYNSNPVVCHEFESDQLVFGDTIVIKKQQQFQIIQFYSSQQILPYAFVKFIWCKGVDGDLSKRLDFLQQKKKNNTGKQVQFSGLVLDNIVPRLLAYISYQCGKCLFKQVAEYNCTNQSIQSNMSIFSFINQLMSACQSDIYYQTNNYNIEGQLYFEPDDELEKMFQNAKEFKDTSNNFKTFTNSIQYFQNYSFSIETACVLLRDIMATHSFDQTQYDWSTQILKKEIFKSGYKFQFFDTFQQMNIQSFSAKQLQQLQKNQIYSLITFQNTFFTTISFKLNHFFSHIQQQSIDNISYETLYDQYVIISNQFILNNENDLQLSFTIQVLNLISNKIKLIQPQSKSKKNMDMFMINITTYNITLNNKAIPILLCLQNYVVTKQIINSLNKQLFGVNKNESVCVNTSINLSEISCSEQDQDIFVNKLNDTIMISKQLQELEVIDLLFSMDQQLTQKLCFDGDYLQFILINLSVTGSQQQFNILLNSAITDENYGILLYKIVFSLLQIVFDAKKRNFGFYMNAYINQHKDQLQILAKEAVSLLHNKQYIEAILSQINYKQTEKITANKQVIFCIITQLLILTCDFENLDEYFNFIYFQFPILMDQQQFNERQCKFLMNALIQLYIINNQSLLIFYFFQKFQLVQYINDDTKNQMSKTIQSNISDKLSDLIFNFTIIDCTLIETARLGNGIAEIVDNQLVMLSMTPLYQILENLILFPDDNRLKIKQVIEKEISFLLSNMHTIFIDSYHKIIKFFLHCIFFTQQHDFLNSQQIISQLVDIKDTFVDIAVIDVLSMHYTQENDVVIIPLINRTKQSFINLQCVKLLNQDISEDLRNLIIERTYKIKIGTFEKKIFYEFIQQNKFQLNNEILIKGLLNYFVNKNETYIQIKQISELFQLDQIQFGQQTINNYYNLKQLTNLINFHESANILVNSYLVQGAYALLQYDDLCINYGYVINPYEQFDVDNEHYKLKIFNLLKNPHDQILHIFQLSNHLLIITKNYLALIKNGKLQINNIYQTFLNQAFTLDKDVVNVLSLVNQTFAYNQQAFSRFSQLEVLIKQNIDITADINYIQNLEIEDFNTRDNTLTIMLKNTKMSISFDNNQSMLTQLENNYTQIQQLIAHESDCEQINSQLKINKLNITPVFYFVDSKIKLLFMQVFLLQFCQSESKQQDTLQVVKTQIQQIIDKFQVNQQNQQNNEVLTTLNLVTNYANPVYLLKLMLKQACVEEEQIGRMIKLDVVDKIYSTYPIYLLEMVK